ncbi:MAG: hypothetical protein M1828_005848 [Chrysothrix sp. TS-e1954]|nr:MAG: hypothetical protein M1828_005848 [Chrysothrix sp. TS-e1954]
MSILSRLVLGRHNTNPREWPTSKKIFHTLLGAAVSFQITFATSTIAGGLPGITQSLNTSEEVAVLSITLYTLGLAVGPALMAPLSEYYGRKPIIGISLIAMMAFTAGSGGANSITTLLVCRWFAGFLGTAGIAVGAGVISDIFPPKEMALPSAVFILMPFFGPSLGPLTSAYILHDENNDWRWTQWILLIVMAPVFCVTLLSQETYAPVLQGTAQLTNTSVDDTTLTKIRRYLRATTVTPTELLFTEPLVFSLSLYTAFNYAVLFGFFESLPYVMETVYGFNSRQANLCFLSFVIGYSLSMPVMFLSDKLLYRRQSPSANGLIDPKHRLYPGILGSICLPLSLFWYAWSAYHSVSWAVPVASGIFFGLGAYTVFVSSITYLIDCYGSRAAASAVAANGFLRYALGAVFPLFVTQMYEKLGVHWAGSIFAFIALVLAPLPWIFFWQGHRLIARSSWTARHVVEQVEKPKKNNTSIAEVDGGDQRL